MFWKYKKVKNKKKIKERKIEIKSSETKIREHFH